MMRTSAGKNIDRHQFSRLTRVNENLQFII